MNDCWDTDTIGLFVTLAGLTALFAAAKWHRALTDPIPDPARRPRHDSGKAAG
jgi:hypothetical protein